MSRVFVTGSGRVSPSLDGSGLKPDSSLGGLLSGRVDLAVEGDEPRLHAMARKATGLALKRAERLGRIHPEQKGVFVSASKGGLEGFPDTGDWLWRYMGDNVGGRLRERLAWYGGGCNTPLACATGAYAMGLAFESLRSGRLKAALAGAAEASLTPLVAAAFRNLGALSGPEYAGPFDRDRAGFVLAEGAGVLLLESEEGLSKTGHEPLAEMLGWACTSDAYHLTAPEPEGREAARCLRLALERAGSPTVGYLNAHGTATPSGDLAEARALHSVFGNGPWPRVSSIKGSVGHVLGAAGAVEAAVTVESLVQRCLPGTRRCVKPMVEMEGRLALEDEDFKHPVAASLSMGFGGHNVALVFRRSR